MTETYDVEVRKLKNYTATIIAKSLESSFRLITSKSQLRNPDAVRGIVHNLLEDMEDFLSLIVSQRRKIEELKKQLSQQEPPQAAE